MKLFLAGFLFLFAGLTHGQSTDGFIDIEKIESSNDWFSKGYLAYEPDKIFSDSIRSLPADRKVIVFAGLWCSDTRDLIPKFYKLSDQVNISRADISLYLLDENKHSQEELEKQFAVTNVPTFIILKDGKEIGRVVESVKTTIEQDLYLLMK